MTEENKPIEEPKLSPAEKMKVENDSFEKELLRKEELNARAKLGGQTNAGQTPEKPKEETPAEYTKRIMEGKI